MKALSFKNPYALLMLHGKVETRTWRTNYRGWVLICTSKKPYTKAQVYGIAGEWQYQRLLAYVGSDWNKNNGMAIAVGKLTDCYPMLPEHEGDCFVKYKPGLFCHRYKDVFPIAPFAFKGQARWLNLTESQLSLIKPI